MAIAGVSAAFCGVPAAGAGARGGEKTGRLIGLGQRHDDIARAFRLRHRNGDGLCRDHLAFAGFFAESEEMVAGRQWRWNEGELTVGIGLRLGDDGAPIEQSDFGIGCRPPGDDRIPCRLDPHDIEAGQRRLPSLRRGRGCLLRLRMVHGAGRDEQERRSPAPVSSSPRSERALPLAKRDRRARRPRQWPPPRRSRTLHLL